jgi:hypothetical protein
MAGAFTLPSFISSRPSRGKRQLRRTALTAIERLTGFDVFTFSLWFIIPAGAIGTGIAAASGYYFGRL